MKSSLEVAPYDNSFRIALAVFVEQCGVDFGGSLIDEPFRVQGVENGPPLLSREGS